MTIVDGGLNISKVEESMKVGGLILPWQLVKTFIKNKLFVNNTKIYIWML